MRFAFIEAERAHYPIRMMCALLLVSRAGFYAWRTREPSARTKEDGLLKVRIRAVFERSRRTYGAPRIQAELREQGHRHARKRLAWLMAQEGICARAKRRFTKTTDSRHDLPVARNLLARNFSPTAPNKSWAGDITYVATAEGWLFLAVVIDLYSRKVVGWAMSNRIDAELALSAVQMALKARGDCPGLVHHSDRGVQYASHVYRELLSANRVTSSMSRKGNCWDNAVVESFFSSLKTEVVYPQPLATRAEARTRLFEYIEVFYNRIRRHSALGYRSPEEFEKVKRTEQAVA